jgi:anti-anti-sigma factor
MSDAFTSLTNTSFLALTESDGVLRAAVLAPHVGHVEAPGIAAEVNGAIERTGPALKAVVLDLTAVGSMTSMGLGLCVDVRNTAWTFGAPTVVLGLRRTIEDLFRLVKLDRIFVMARDEAELRLLMRL